MRLGAVVVGVIAALVAAGCTGEDEAAITEAALPRLVLQPADFPHGWVQFDARRAPDEPLEGESPQEGRATAASVWVARYRRSGTSTTRGPLVVESRARVFTSAEAAGRAIPAAGRQAGTRVDAPRIGHETLATTLVQSGVTPVRFYTIVWRHANVVATVTVNGFDRRTTLADAIALARKQQRRLERAAGS